MRRRNVKKLPLIVTHKNSVSLKTQDYSLKVLGVLVTLRLLNVFMVNTWFVPDEYWQSLEVAHKLTYGYGYLTWEWKEGIRSYLHPILFCIYYYFIEIIGLSRFSVAVVYGPRVIQGILSAFAEFCFYKFICRSFNKQVAIWTMFSLCSSWFWWFCATRTLINSLESIFICFSMYFLKWKDATYCKNFKMFLFISSMTISIRLTSLSIIIPLCFLFMYRFFLVHSYCSTVIVVLKSFLISLLCFMFLFVIDCICYGRWVSVHYNFVAFNLFNNQSTFYGSHPWHWYLTQGIPVVIGSHLPFIFHGLILSFAVIYHKKFTCEQQLMLCFLISIFLTVFLYSLPGHKEFRFLLSICPMFMLFSGISLTSMSSHVRNIFVFWLFTTNFLAMLYTGFIHQAAPLDVMDYIRNNVARNNSNPSRYDILFLLPCHSTPYYSHIHRNLSLRFLTCEPCLHDNKSNYIDEADMFYANPSVWLKENLFHKNNIFCDDALPNFIVAYNVLVKDQWSLFSLCYNVVHDSFHSHFPEGRVGDSMLILKKVQN